MKNGQLQQVDSPLGLYDRPKNLFVASFIGSPAMSLIPAKLDDGHARIGDYAVAIDRASGTRSTGDITIGVRPESWRIVGERENGLPIRITAIEELGADAFIYGTCEVEGDTITIAVHIGGRQQRRDQIIIGVAGRGYEGAIRQRDAGRFGLSADGLTARAWQGVPFSPRLI